MTITPITEKSPGELAARRLAAKYMKLINDPEGLNLPDELWQQMEEQLNDMATVIATEIIRQNPADSIDNLGDGESLYFMAENPVINVRELAEAIMTEAFNVR